MTGERRTAEEAHKRTLFIGKVNRFQPDPGPDSVLPKRLQHFECGDHPQRAVEAPAVRDGVEM